MAGTAAQFRAELYFRNEQPYKTIEELDSAVREFNSAFGEDNFLAALISGRLVSLKLQYGGLPEALEQISTIRRVLSAQLGADHPETIELLTVEATCHEIWGDWKSYTACYESYFKQLDAIELHNKQELISIAKQQLAFGYSRSFEFDKASSYFDESEELIRDLYGEPSVELACWMFIRADGYVGTGEWKDGELLLAKSLANLDALEADHSGGWNEPTLNTLHRIQAETIHRQALCALYDGQLDKGFRLRRGKQAFLRAKQMLEELGLQNSLRYVFVLRQLCEIEYLTKTSLPDAEASETRANAYIDEACEKYRQLCGGQVGPYHPLLQYYRIATARAWGRYEQAIAEFYEGVRQNSVHASKTKIAMCFREAGLTFAAMKKPVEAVEVYSQAIDLYGECFFLDLLSSSDSQADGYAKFSRDCLKDMVAAADKSDPAQVEIMFEYVSRIKGMVARAQAMRSQISAHVGSSDRADLSEQLFVAGGRIFNLILEKAKTPGPDPQIDDQISQLTRQKRDLVSKLGNSIPFHEIQFESNIISRLREQMPVNSTVVDFFRQPENQIEQEDVYYAFVFRNLSDGFDLTCRKLGSADEIDEKVAGLNDSVLQVRETDSGQSAYESNAAVLRDRIWNNLRPCFGDSKTIVVCGDGLLGSVPWCGLPSVSNPVQYLVDEFEIVPAVNSRDLVENMEAPCCFGEGSLLVGNLDYGPLEPSASANSAFAFCKLEESDQELEAARPLLSSFGVVTTLQDDEATATAVKDHLDRARFAHFATHGFFLPASQDGFKAQPFVRVGLALSGANDLDHRGFLSGEQIISMNLTNLELVVLSACDSSPGLAIGGEGIFGVQRAFLLAGAKTCIASRWPVEDTAARKFMSLFYENLVDGGRTKIEAIREAQIEMHKQGYPPQSWANWQLLGDWR
jgi:tetratricopeptide (TPR) repeat protein